MLVVVFPTCVKYTTNAKAAHSFLQQLVQFYSIIISLHVEMLMKKLPNIPIPIRHLLILCIFCVKL